MNAMNAMNDETSTFDVERLLDEARAIVAGETEQRPTALHLWALLSALDGTPDRDPPPTVFGQRRLPLTVH